MSEPKRLTPELLAEIAEHCQSEPGHGSLWESHALRDLWAHVAALEAECVRREHAEAAAMALVMSHEGRIESMLADRLDAIDKAVEAEREACAQVCESWDDGLDHNPTFPTHADRIRDRAKP